MLRNNRRGVLKKSGLIGAGLILGSTGVVSANNSDDVSSDDYINPPGGSGTGHSINRSAESSFFSGEEGTSYTSAGSIYERASELTWNSGIEKWQVSYHTWAFACTSYELDNGGTGSENLFRSQHRIIVEHDNSDQISTRAHDDVDWGVSTIGSDSDELSPEEAVVDAAANLFAEFGSGIGAIHTVTDLINNLNEAAINGDIDKTWHLPNMGQSRMGHYLLYDHTFPPYEDFGEDIISVSLTHRLQNSLYKTTTNYTSNREPTDEYDYTHTYYIGVPNNPEGMSSRELRDHGIEQESSDKYIVKDFDKLESELDVDVVE